jgi:putative Holliday junction resolvase
MNRILGVDLGTERTGIAVGSFGVAHPLTVLEAHEEERIVAGIARHAREQDAREIVFGLAISLNGTEGPAAARQRAIAKLVEAETSLPVHLWDERLTTAEAERALLGAGLDRKQRRGLVDKVAATILLQSYLDSKAGPPPENP